MCRTVVHKRNVISILQDTRDALASEMKKLLDLKVIVFEIRDIEKCLFQIISLFLIQVMGMVNENIWMFYTIYLTSQINYSKIYRNKQLRKTQV